MNNLEVGKVLRRIRTDNNFLLTSFLQQGLQVVVINNLEENRGSLSSFLKYITALGLELELKPISTENKLCIVKWTEKTHISLDGQNIICGKNLKGKENEITFIKVDNIDPRKGDCICKRCLEGYRKRQRQKTTKNLP